jgi:hypothetical protein
LVISVADPDGHTVPAHLWRYHSQPMLEERIAIVLELIRKI